jgi:hypothetical protein
MLFLKDAVLSPYPRFIEEDEKNDSGEKRVS